MGSFTSYKLSIPPAISQNKSVRKILKMSTVSSTPSRTHSPVANQPFPGIYVRERTPPPTVENRAELPDGKEDYEEAITAPPTRVVPPEHINRGRVNYKPIPEKRMLGYMSTAALIINKMIGTGIFSMPSSVLASTGSKGGSLFLWATGGIMTLSGWVTGPICLRLVCANYALLQPDSIS